MGELTEMESLECPLDPTLQEDLEKIAVSSLPWSVLERSTLLVTGATGLIGSILVKAILTINRLHNTQIQIIAMVHSLEKAFSTFGTLLNRPELNIISGDIAVPFAVNHSVDYIIHTASITASKELVTHPVNAIEVAVEGTKNILELAKKKKCKSVVYLSSMEVYGTFSSLDKHRITENELGYVDLSSVRSCYPESKRMCENMCICYATQYNIPVKIARLAQTFGAGVPLSDNRVFAQFAKSAIAGKNIVLHTKGESNGNYCYTADAVLGILTILLLGENTQAYNVVSEVATTTIAQMAKMVSERITQGKSSLIFDIPANSQTYGYAPDVKLRLSSQKIESLGWKPLIAPELETMYRRLIASFKAQAKTFTISPF